MNDTEPTVQRIAISPHDQLLVTHPTIEHDSTPATRYSLVDDTHQLGPSSVVLLMFLNAARTSRHEHTTGHDAGDLARQLGLNMSRFDHTINRLSRFHRLTIEHAGTTFGRQFVEITLTSQAAR